MFAKKYFTVAISILFASMMFFMISCDKSSPTGGTSTGTVDAALVGVWFDRSDSTGSEIKSDGTLIPLELGPNNFLVAVNIGTESLTLTASGGNYTFTRKTKVEGTTRDTTIIIKGTYTVTATTLTTTDPSGTMILTKSAYGVNVFTYTGGGGSGLTATPTSISVVAGSNATSTISGGTAPYSIQSAPTSSYATAAISGTTLNVTGVAAGSTSVIVKDNGSPAKTVTIPITVTTSGGGGGGGFTTAGTVTFSSNKGNFTASGIYNGNATTGSGAGAYTQSSGGSNMLQVTSFRVNSATSIDIAIITFINSNPIATGTYTSTSSKMVMIYYFPAMNPNDTTENFYLLTTATSDISAISSSNAVGTFSGNGMYSANGTLVPTNSIAVTSGTFNVPVMPLIALNILRQPIDAKIERIIKRIASLR